MGGWLGSRCLEVGRAWYEKVVGVGEVVVELEEGEMGMK
jgi:hypothetical protein